VQSPPSKPFRSRSPPPLQRAGAQPPRSSTPQPYVFSDDADVGRDIAHIIHTYPQLCLILTIASTYFIALFKQSEATSSTTTHPSELTTLAYLSFLFSMLGTLSGALSTGPVPRTRYQDQPAFVESPGRPASANNAFLLGVMFRLTPPRRLIQRMWDFRE
jgi:hypothetical protein